MKHFAVAIAVTVGLAAISFGQSKPAGDASTSTAPVGDAQKLSKEDARAQERLQKNLPKVTFDGVDLANVLDFFGMVTGVKFSPDWTALEKAGVNKKTRVIKLDVTNQSAQTLLERVLAGLPAKSKIGYAIRNGEIIVSTQDALATSQPVAASQPASTTPSK